MRVVVRALLDSVTAILNVLIVIALIWYIIGFNDFSINSKKIANFRLMFAILGISLIGGRMGYCDHIQKSYFGINEDKVIEFF